MLAAGQHNEEFSFGIITNFIRTVVGLIVVPKKTCPHSNSMNLWILPYLEKGPLEMVIKIKAFAMRSSWIFQVGPQSYGMAYILISVGQWEIWCKQKRRRQCDPKDRDYSGAGPSQRMLTATESWKKKEPILPKSFWRECGPASTLISNFWLPERRENTFLLH